MKKVFSLLVALAGFMALGALVSAGPKDSPKDGVMTAWVKVQESKDFWMLSMYVNQYAEKATKVVYLQKNKAQAGHKNPDMLAQAANFSGRALVHMTDDRVCVAAEDGILAFAFEANANGNRQLERGNSIEMPKGALLSEVFHGVGIITTAPGLTAGQAKANARKMSKSIKNNSNDNCMLSGNASQSIEAGGFTATCGQGYEACCVVENNEVVCRCVEK